MVAAKPAKVRGPPPPAHKSVVYQRAATRMGKWQKWYMALDSSALYLSQDADPVETPVTVVAAADVKTVKGSYNGDKQLLYVANTAGEGWVLKLDDAAGVDTWVAKINAAKEYVARHRRAAAAARARADSDAADSDADDDDSALRLPAAPRWFQQYDALTRDKERDSEWMTITMKWIDSLFADIYQKPGDAADDAVETDSASAKVVISKLSEATTRACGLFIERVRECRSRTRPDILKHLVTMLDLRFLQELTPLTTGAFPAGAACVPPITNTQYHPHPHPPTTYCRRHTQQAVAAAAAAGD